MPEFRLTQISDTHLAPSLRKINQNFHSVSDHIDATHPDIIINTGDLAYDVSTSRHDLAFAWLDRYQPVTRVGKSILLYYIPAN